MATLVCENIKKSYKNNEVLKGIDLTIEQGKIYGLIGRNGAGKTTLLSILTAQTPANSGNVLCDGETVWENRKALDHLCFSREISTNTAIGPNNQKIKEYFRMASMLYPNWDQEMADRLLAHFKLDVKKKVNKLSKGMLSMVTIIIGLASKAEITILDEPVAGLDVVAREDFYRLVIEEQTENNRTFIISTHIIEEAADVFEEVMFLDRGKIIIKENCQELLERACHISGNAEDVDAATEGLHTYHVEKMGRSEGATLLLNPGESLKAGYDITVQPITLQNLFVALCGKEEEEA